MATAEATQVEAQAELQRHKKAKKHHHHKDESDDVQLDDNVDKTWV
jgi:hypothetical protein